MYYIQDFVLNYVFYIAWPSLRFVHTRVQRSITFQNISPAARTTYLANASIM